jgi:Flp pilus assembly pilin Flp
MKRLSTRFLHDDSGQDLIEYGLLVGIITALGAAVMGDIGLKVKQFFDDLKSAIGA